MKLSGKTAVITGGNSGIGLATAKLFAQEGAQIVILGRDDKTLAAAKEALGGKAIALKTDVASLDQLDAAVRETGARFGKIDILFANAGIAEFAPMDQIDERFFDKTFDINVKGVYFTTQKFAPLLRDNSSVLFTTTVVNQKAGRAPASMPRARPRCVRWPVHWRRNCSHARFVSTRSVRGRLKHRFTAASGCRRKPCNNWPPTSCNKRRCIVLVPPTKLPRSRCSWRVTIRPT